jgi:hypothetical protein
VRFFTNAVYRGDDFMNKTVRLSLLLLTLLTFLVTPILAQTTGSISGEVKDEKQAVINGATVTLRNVTTNQSRTSQTDSDGRYRFTGVPVGDYEVTVESTGFAKYVQSGIKLELNQPATVDVTMKPGAVTEVVKHRGECVDTQHDNFGSRDSL